MDIHVKKLKDDCGCCEYVIYESGKFSKPIMILSEGFAEDLICRLTDAVDSGEQK